MEFTKDKIGQAWILFNKSIHVSEKKEANNYISKFYEYENAIPICFELLEDFNNLDYCICACFALHKIIKQKNEFITKNQNIYNFIKNKLFNEIYPKITTINSNLVINKLCFCGSLIVILGLFNLWENSIEDTLKFSEIKSENLFIGLNILGEINSELDSLNLPQKNTLQIKDILIEKNELIKNFVYKIFENQNNIQENLRKIIIDKNINLCSNWAKFNLNLLESEVLTKKIITNINLENVEKISELLFETISNSQSKKIYSECYFEEKNDIFNEIEKKINNKEIESIINITNMIETAINNYKNIQDSDDKLLIGIANIFSSISENYLYLFFLKNEISQKLLNLFLFFITSNKRKISIKFFESLAEMREFINEYYKFSNLNDEDKKNFIEFLFKINDSIMNNCKLKSLNIKYDLIYNNNLLSLDLEHTNSSNLLNSNNNLIPNENEIESDLNEISVVDYRNSAEDVFVNIFLILLMNFKDEGAKFFFEKIFNILKNINIYDNNILNDKNKLLISETSIFVMRCITECFEYSNNIDSIINDFINYILNSQLINNESLTVNFLLFLDKASKNIPKFKDTYEKTIDFILKISHNISIEKISTYIIDSICIFSIESNKNVFEKIYKNYNENYDNYSNSECVSNLSNALINCLCINQLKEQNKNINYEEIKNYYFLILKTASERIIKIGELFKNGSFNNYNNNQIKLEILKNYGVHKKILKSAKKIDDNFYYEIFKYHFNDTFSITEIIIENYINKDKDLISFLISNLNEYVSNLCDKIELFFDKLNNILVKIFLSNSYYYKSLTGIKLLYYYYATIKENYCELIKNNFFILSKEICLKIINEKKFQIEILKEFSDLFYYIFPKLNCSNLNNEQITLLLDIIKIFIDGLNNLNENSLIKNLINALSCFISHENFNKDIIINKYLEINYNLFNNMEKFDTKSKKEFSKFCSNSFNFDKNGFLNFVKDFFSKNENFNKIFSSNYLQVIYEYIEKFGDSDIKLNNIFDVIVDIKQGKTRLESLNFFGMEIARSKIIKN